MKTRQLSRWGLSSLVVLAGALAFGATSNQPPTISGSPVTTVKVGSSYQFRPKARDADSRTLGFSISNKPAWATFNVSKGWLTGTPSAADAGTYANIVISVSDGTTSVSLPSFSITVTGAPTTNNPPSISGTPRTSIEAGSSYSFTPAASDPEGDALTFSVSGLPSWASFNAGTGALTGTPAASQIGSYGNIVISVSDGASSRSLPAFSINVTSSGTGTGTATLSWSAPVSNTDGTALSNLAGYRIYHGTSASAMNDVRPINSPGITTFVFDALASGTHYFAISAVNSMGIESAQSAALTKIIP